MPCSARPLVDVRVMSAFISGMGIHVIPEILLLLSLVQISLASGPILCVRCNSGTDHASDDCEHKPPSPVRCTSNKDVEQYCITARELATDGTLVRFIRDCSTKNMGDKCHDYDHHNPNSPAKVCYTTCDYDGCNRATAIVSSLWMFASLALTLMNFRF